MKSLNLALALTVLLPTVGQTSINPEKSIYNFLNVFSSGNKLLSDGTVEILQKQYDKNGKLSNSREKFILKNSDYQELVSRSKAVFVVEPKERGTDEMIYKGTAFHIGNGLVLTNLHVLSRDFENLTKCDKFRIKDHTGGDFFNCQKVHYCHKKDDVCLIEMQPRKFGTPWNPQYESFADQASLKIESKEYLSDELMVLTSIGNSQGLGIHASQGRGIIKGNNFYNFYAAVRDGNSGGPIINEQGHAIGVVRRESPVKVGPAAYNVAAPTSHIIPQIREALKADPETLEKFNQAVLE